MRIEDVMTRNLVGTGADASFAEAARLLLDYRQSDLVTIGPDAPLGEAIELMLKHRLKRLAVVSDEDELLGLVSSADVVQALLTLTAVIDDLVWVEPAEEQPTLAPADGEAA